ncbi:hypothetical protein ZIOFF_068041 [Zingiber officinale]|uniref:dUTP diphosphatase n=1 Tax=Zingiber officinale TaxID=94328 RepID=A0A8J5C7F0_ZINOF|nr:hypothetical protein ZIOFF_068041 [Zingiber officinale]
MAKPICHHGVRTLLGWRYSINPLLGLNWIIRPTAVAIPMQPSEVNSRNLMDGRISFSFSNYRAARRAESLHYNTKDEEVQSDEEHFHTIAVLIEQAPEGQQNLDPEVIEENMDLYPHILVRLISPHTKLPIRRSLGATGYDLAASQDCVILVRGCAQIPTGVCIEIPWGSYGRIVPRSGTVWKLGLDIGARVIDMGMRRVEARSGKDWLPLMDY